LLVSQKEIIILTSIADVLDEQSGHVEISKTGMGSSAALTCALVGSLLNYFGIVNLVNGGSNEDRTLVHNLSQIVHSIAQGKIGSGFDVSSGIFGSQMYSRFDPNIFSLQDFEDDWPSLHRLVVDRDAVKSWTQSIIPITLPCGIHIVMGDVCGGSSSSQMVFQ
jgi:phosphomevalonate kinase